MRKFQIVSILLLTIVLMSVSIVQATTLEEIQKRGTIKILINSGVKPFTFLDKSGKPAGMCVDLGKLIAEKMGVEVQFVDVQWSGLIPALLSKRADLIGDRMSNTLERAEKINFADSYLKTGTIAYTRTETPYENIDDIDKAGVKVGVILGTIGESIAREKLNKAEIIPFDSTAETTQALETGRVDAALEDDVVALRIAQNKSNLKPLKGYLFVDTYSFAVRQEDDELRLWVNLFFERIKRSGQFGDIYEKWLKTPWNSEPQKSL